MSEATAVLNVANDRDDATPSKRSTATPKGDNPQPSSAAAYALQLIGDLPRAEADALRTFLEIPTNTYQNNSLGRSRQVEEGMACECQYDHGNISSSSSYDIAVRTFAFLIRLG
jgi:histone-lysine N-methyltransferase SETD2